MHPLHNMHAPLNGDYSKLHSRRGLNQDVHDKANANVRVNGEDIQASIVIEGANLGVTQAGRVAYALKGGVINTDGTDNSAGVDCSDHEVNIKIFLRHMRIPEADIPTWLAEMKDDVTELVLTNNKAQNEALTHMESESPTYEPLRQYFKKKGVRDGLPRGLQLYQRPRHHWTRPELAYLMAYIKNDFCERLTEILPHMNINLFNQDVFHYFPHKMQQYFGGSLADHPLRLPLVATLLSNHIINTWGPLWALPDQPLKEWITHYQWIRDKHTPDRSEALMWRILLAYLTRYSHQNRNPQAAYNMLWNHTPSPTWQILWSGLKPCGNIPAVWDLGAIALSHALQSSDTTFTHMPSQPHLPDWAHFILNLPSLGDNHV